MKTNTASDPQAQATPSNESPAEEQKKTEQAGNNSWWRFFSMWTT